MNRLKNKGGRPTKAAEDKKVNAIKIRLTDAQLEFILNHAENAGYTQPARFLSDMLWSCVESGNFSYNTTPSINREAINELNRVGKNINDAMHAYHASENQEHLAEAISYASDVNDTLRIVLLLLKSNLVKMKAAGGIVL